MHDCAWLFIALLCSYERLLHADRAGQVVYQCFWLLQKKGFICRFHTTALTLQPASLLILMCTSCLSALKHMSSVYFSHAESTLLLLQSRFYHQYQHKQVNGSLACGAGGLKKMKQSSMICLGSAAHPQSKPHSAVIDTTVSMCT